MTDCVIMTRRKAHILDTNPKDQTRHSVDSEGEKSTLTVVAPMAATPMKRSGDDVLSADARQIAEALLGRLGRSSLRSKGQDKADTTDKDARDGEDSAYDIESALRRAMERMRRRNKES